MFVKKIISFILLFSILSCAETLDFSQIEDYRATPEYTFSLTYFKITPIQFFNQSGIQESERTDITDFRVFDNDFLRNNLVKIDFNVEVSNQINKGFTMEVAFLNENQGVTHKFQDIVVNSNTKNFKFLETIDVTTKPNVKNSTKIKIVVKMNNSNPPLSASDTSEFEFKSSAKIYIDTGN